VRSVTSGLVLLNDVPTYTFSTITKHSVGCTDECYLQARYDSRAQKGDL
jgi:hypothetical protein